MYLTRAIKYENTLLPNSTHLGDFQKKAPLQGGASIINTMKCLVDVLT